MAMINRLLDSLYNAYDKDPHQVIALRIQHPAGFSWSIASRTLTAKTEAADTIGVYSLNDHTVATLADALVSDGCSLAYINTDVQDRLAASLLAGSNRQSISNGDALSIYDTLLWSMLDAYALALEQAGAQIPEAIKQIDYTTAGGEFLDVWGGYFGIPRLLGETDADYQVRTIDAILSPKVNGYAMAAAVSLTAGQPVSLHEPWQDLLRLSESRLDNERFYDGDRWSPYLYRPILKSLHNIHWDAVLAQLERIRPAGVFGLPPEWRPAREVVVAVGDYGCGLIRLSRYVMQASTEDRMLLDYYHLDDEVVQNYRINVFQLISVENKTGVPDPYRLSSNRHFVRAQIVLSDMDEPFGHERFMFPGYAWVSRNIPVLSDFVLSEYDPGIEIYAFEDVYIIPFGVEMDSSALVLPEIQQHSVTHQQNTWLQIDTSVRFVLSESLLSDFDPTRHFVRRERDFSWEGSWDKRTWQYDYFIASFRLAVSAIKIITETT